MPLPLAVLLILLAIFLWRRNRVRSAFSLSLLALGILYLFSITPVAFLLTRSLEAQVPASLVPEDLDAIVILAGSARQPGCLAEKAELSGASWLRLWRGLELYRQLDQEVPIIYSGGSGSLFNPRAIEGCLARSYVLSMGIPSEKFLVEDDSRNTYENARETAKILARLQSGDRPRIALVTSAIHLPRAIKVFSGEGIDIFPIRADIPFGYYQFDISSIIPSASTLALSTRCIHEWLGLLGYRVFY